MFDFDEIIDRRGTHCTKWDMMQPLYGVAPDDGIAMWVADMDFRPPAAVAARARGRGRARRLRLLRRRPRLQGGDPRLDGPPARLGGRSGRDRHHPRRRLRPRPLLDAFTQPGDGVILFTPVYHAFSRIIRANRREIVAVAAGGARGRPLRDRPPRARRRAHRPRAHASSSARRTTRPAGSGPATSSASSPISAPRTTSSSSPTRSTTTSSCPAARHVPMPLAAPEILDRLVMLTATTKTFNIAGALTGNVIIPDEALRRRFAAAHLASGTSANRFGAVMATAAYSRRRRLGRRAHPLSRRQRRDLPRRPRRDPRPHARCRSTPPISPGSISPAPA